MRCNLKLLNFFHTVQVPFPSHFYSGFSDPVNPVLHAGPLASCHNFISFRLWRIRWSDPGRSRFRSDISGFLVDSLYTEARMRVREMPSYLDLIWIHGESTRAVW